MITYCNPLNLDYAYVANRPQFAHFPHRSTADPVFFTYQGKMYLFATNQYGYWWSRDLAKWTFVPHEFAYNGVGDQVCAPGAWPTDKGVLFLACFGEGEKMPLYLGTDLLRGTWQEANPRYPKVTWDPSFFQDDDGKVYLYWGSSNVYPLYGTQVDPAHGYQPIGPTVPLMKLDQKLHGWEQFGEDNVPDKLDPFVEGAWVNKFKGKYYLQYGAPGTEWNVYGDGVYVADQPLGPFKYQEYSPFSWKPTGFIRGAGHGSTFADPQGRLWHAATMDICVKNTFERRMGLFPASVDADGVLSADTAFGDYPHTLPALTGEAHSTFTGWTLLSYRKPARSDVPRSQPALAFDEDIKTYWTAPDGKPGHWLQVDLGKASDVQALQINYADERATLYGKHPGLRHRYKLLGSTDGKAWRTLVDKSRNMEDVPHDYVELKARTRYMRLVNIEVPTGCFAISGLRVFGRAPGAAPRAVGGFAVHRDRDRRIANLTWRPVPGAYAYDVRFGIHPDKLNQSLLVHDATRYTLRGLNVAPGYHFKIRAVGETGLSPFSRNLTVN
jgi:hypothetical protein